MKIPRDCRGWQLAKALRVLGYVPTRQSGSHLRVSTERDGQNHETIPMHKAIKPGLLHGILKHVADHHGLTVQELLDLLDL